MAPCLNWTMSFGWLVSLAAAGGAFASTRTIDFENLAVGTVVAGQYDGLAFSAQPQSCGGAPAVNLVITTPNGGTSSGARGLGITTGCPDFSPDYIRLVFTQLQQQVAFTLGDSAGQYQVRAYNTAGTRIINQTVTLGGTGFVGVFRLVTVQRPTADIKRIEIDSTVDNYEAIDDLTFACPDLSPPVVEISTPLFGSCQCGTGLTVRGRACDEEGYDHDTLEYCPVGTQAGTGWTLIGTASIAQCTPNGMLYFWNTTGVPDGGYYLKLTSYNACDLVSTATSLVWLDRAVDAPVVRSPAESAIVGGSVCVDGTVWDGAEGNCLASYSVDYRPAGGADWTPVDSGHLMYTTPVITDPLAQWVTNSLPDGAYQLRVRATNICGANSPDVTRSVIVDNTAPVASLAQPLACQVVDGLVSVRGTASDANLDQWVLQYTGGDSHGWVTLNKGTGSMINQALVAWDTTDLRPCDYALRLVVTDKAVRDCNNLRRNTTEFLTTVHVGQLGLFDYDGDGDVDLTDFAAFQRCESGPAIPALPQCLSR